MMKLVNGRLVFDEMPATPPPDAPPRWNPDGVRERMPQPVKQLLPITRRVLDAVPHTAPVAGSDYAKDGPRPVTNKQLKQARIEHRNATTFHQLRAGKIPEKLRKQLNDPNRVQPEWFTKQPTKRNAAVLPDGLKQDPRLLIEPRWYTWPDRRPMYA